MEPIRRVKIVATLGPATDAPGALEALIEAGVDVARLNLSHGTHEEHAARYRRVREASDRCGRAVGVLADLQGPKIRVGGFDGGSALLSPGAEFVITSEAVTGDAHHVSTSYEALPGDVKAGDCILIDDGNVRLEVLGVDGPAVRTRVIEGGIVSDHKGLNLPGVKVSAPPLTPKDVDDLRFALSLRVDFVALSFVRDPRDVTAVHQVMDVQGSPLPVIAKLEKPDAVQRLDEIVAAFDGLMVARGDLGVETALEKVPRIQKSTIRRERRKAGLSITATQMLESMIEHPSPTGAEVSDVANAI